MSKLYNSKLVYVSTGAFRTRSLTTIIESCARCGIQHLELSSGLEHEEKLLDATRYLSSDLNFLVHNYFPPPKDPFVINLASESEQIAGRTIAHCRTAIDLCQKLAVPFYSLHAGSAVDPLPSDLGQAQTHLRLADPGNAYSLFVQRAIDLGDYAARRGTRLLIENHVVAPFNLTDGKNLILFGSTASELRAMMSDIDHPNVGLLIDLGHLKVTANTLGFDPHSLIDAVGPYIEAFHVSDNDGVADTNEVFSQNVWFADIMRRFRSATVVLEVYDLNMQEIVTCRNELSTMMDS